MSDLTLRAPGPLDLIGEHMDHMDAPVIPMTILKGIAIPWSVADEAGSGDLDIDDDELVRHAIAAQRMIGPSKGIH